jgi:hypothetical protein
MKLKINRTKKAPQSRKLKMKKRKLQNLKKNLLELQSKRALMKKRRVQLPVNSLLNLLKKLKSMPKWPKSLCNKEEMPS